ncbi:MAG: 50S ribosomal protein L22 [Candidatus Sungbacteria bacterium]|nr:50S ribosomal protein L22 [Candidatus Sungbacteria bacterium]
MEIKAKLNYLRIAPRKVRLVADAIRGLPVLEAERRLTFLTKRAATPILKLLHSAEANAKNNFSIQKENLRVIKITVDGGPVLKRSMPRAFGKAAPIRKRTSHILLILAESEKGKAANKQKHLSKARVVQRIADAEELKAGAEARLMKAKFGGQPERVGPKRDAPNNAIRRIFQRKAI